MKTAAFSCLALATFSNALHLPVQRVRTRATSSNAMSKPSGGAGLHNLENNLYTAEFQVGNSSFTLALDTGSSDLWFIPGLDSSAFANAVVYQPALSLNLSYGTGSVVGDVAQLESLTFAGFTITNQSYLSVTSQDAFFDQIEAQEPQFQGLAGLSFDTISSINTAVLNATQDTWGRSLMSNVFLSDPTTPNHIAFFLDRTGDLNDTDTGSFDIGTYAPGYESVAKEEKHSVFTGLASKVIQWNVILSGLTIGGRAQKLKSEIVASGGLVNVPPAGSLSALFDTGTSAAQIPLEAFKALYEAMGGVLINETGQYAVPCMAETEVEFKFGNQTVSVHPLDLTYIQPTSNNLTVCVSSYEAGKYGGADNDIILGDALLRNVYTVYNYGDFVKTESGLATNSPFVQFLPLTNSSAASAEFKQARAQALASLPSEVDVHTINDPDPKPASSGSSGSGSTGSNMVSGIGKGKSGTSNLDSLGSSGTMDSDAYNKLDSLSTLAPIMLGLLGACVALLVVLIAVVAVMFSRLKKQTANARSGAYVPVALEREKIGDYKDEPHAKYESQFRD